MFSYIQLKDVCIFFVGLAGTGSKGEFHLEFRVRFYVENPSQLDEPQTRHFFFLQTWSDLVGGVLTPSPQTTCLLTGYYLQGGTVLR